MSEMEKWVALTHTWSFNLVNVLLGTYIGGLYPHRDKREREIRQINCDDGRL